jgi:hypothetical protein
MIAGAALAACAILAPMAAEAQRQQVRGQINVINQRAAVLTELIIAEPDGKVIAQLPRPLAAGRTVPLRLQRSTTCGLQVQAKFDDEGEVDETVDLCRERQLRFRD